MSALDKAKLKELVQKAVDDLGSSTTAANFILPNIDNLDFNKSSAVETVNDLPDLYTSGVPSGQIVYVNEINLPVISIMNRWVSLDGTVLRTDENYTLWSWGANSLGQLGDNTYINRSSPTAIVNLDANWTSNVSSRFGNSFAIKNDGTVWGWGDAEKTGDLPGVTDYDSVTYPIKLNQCNTWAKVFDSFGRHTLALKSDGTLWGWGRNQLGELGIGCAETFTASPMPLVGGITDWVFLSSGYSSATAIRSDGTAWSWGSNWHGQIGDGTNFDSLGFYTHRSSPVLVTGGFTDWIQVGHGDWHTIGLRNNGTVWAWGRNHCGQLGDGTINYKSSPVQICGGFTDWCAISASNKTSAAIRTNGTIWSWGWNASGFRGGALGDGTTVNRSSPVSVIGGFTDWCQVSAGSEMSLGLRSNGTLWSWGVNDYGQLGIGTCCAFNDGSSSPVSVIGGFTDWCFIKAGRDSSAAIRTNGTLWTWGYSGYAGKLGDGTKENRSSPVSVIGGFTDWCAANPGYGSMIAIRENGSIWSVGENRYGQLGDGTAGFNYKSSPVSVAGINNWSKITTTGYSRCTIHALRSNGTIWGWGYSGFKGVDDPERLGVGLHNNLTFPVPVTGGFTDWCQAIGGDIQSLGIRNNGTLWAWGYGLGGELGIDNRLITVSPVSVVGGFTDWCQASLSDVHGIGLRCTGSLWTWGRNWQGALGVNLPTNCQFISPVSVVGGFTDWCQVCATGRFSTAFTVGVRTNGTLWAWGTNCSGQLGDGTTVCRSSPVSVVGGFTDWCKISTGGYHTVALKKDGALWSWGRNFCGSLGDGTTVCRSSPVTVVGGFTDWVNISANRCSTIGVRSGR